MVSIGENNKNVKKSWKDQILKRKRWILGLLLLVGNFYTSSMRTHLGVSMVCMVNATAVHELSKKLEVSFSLPKPINPQCQRTFVVNETKAIAKGYKGTFVWSNEEQALLFSSGFYGNLLIMFFPGFLINHYGTKNVLLGCAIGMALTSLLMPTFAHFGLYYFFFIRVIFGIFEYSFYSAMMAPLSLWFTQNERSTSVAIVTSGSPLASSLGVLIATNLCSLNWLNGWPLIFYFTGIATLIWGTIMLIFFTNSPKKSKFLSNDEKQYLANINEAHSDPDGYKKKNIPLKKMLLSSPMIAVMVAAFAHEVASSLMQNFLPTYVRDVLYLDLKSNGIFTAITFISKFFSKYLLSFSADFMKSKKILTPTTSTKFFQCAACYGVAIVFIIIVLFIDCTRIYLALIALAFFGFFSGSSVPGYGTASCSFAPMYTGMVTSITQISGAIGNLLAPVLVGILVKKGQTNEWAYVFITVAFINVISGSVYLFYGSADIQPWAIPEIASTKTLQKKESKDFGNENQGFQKNENAK